MLLSEQGFDELLPRYLHETTKGRIRLALSQFQTGETIDYSSFYAVDNTPFLMQADLISSVRGIQWDEDSGSLESGYNSAMFISNSCDVSSENVRSINLKEALFAPIIPLEDYIEDCINSGFNKSQIDDFTRVLKKQEFTNLFYLPPNTINGRDFFVRFDRIYWLPASLLKDTIKDLQKNRFISLSQWAWYLFIVKLSLHTCRAPEEIERTQN